MIDGKIEGIKLSIKMLTDAMESARLANDEKGVAYFEFWITVYQSRIEDRKRELQEMWN